MQLSWLTLRFFQCPHATFLPPPLLKIFLSVCVARFVMVAAAALKYANTLVVPALLVADYRLALLVAGRQVGRARYADREKSNRVWRVGGLCLGLEVFSHAA